MFLVEIAFADGVNKQLAFNAKEAAEAAAQRLISGHFPIEDDAGGTVLFAAKPIVVGIQDAVLANHVKRAWQRRIEEAELAERTTGIR